MCRDFWFIKYNQLWLLEEVNVFDTLDGSRNAPGVVRYRQQFNTRAWIRPSYSQHCCAVYQPAHYTSTFHSISSLRSMTREFMMTFILGPCTSSSTCGHCRNAVLKEPWHSVGWETARYSNDHSFISTAFLVSHCRS